MRVFGIILAGGTGQRFGDATPKQFIRLAGEPVLRRSTAALASSGLIDQVIVVANAEWQKETHDATGCQARQSVSSPVERPATSRRVLV